MALRLSVKGEYHLFFVLFILLLVTLISEMAQAKTFKYSNGMTIEAQSYKEAALKCYKLITKDRYVSEEFNLTAIDICVNPR